MIELRNLDRWHEQGGQRTYVLRRVDHMIPPRKRRDVRNVMREIDRVVAGWVRGQGIVTSILAVLYAIGFTIVGMPLSVPINITTPASRSCWNLRASVGRRDGVSWKYGSLSGWAID